MRHLHKLLKNIKRVANPSTNEAILLEPPYIDDLKPKVGVYKLLDFAIVGYDYAVLEKYQSYLHKTMRKMKLNVVDSWSVPRRDMSWELLKPQSSTIESVEKIWIYERNLQVRDALITQLPIFIDIMNNTLPPGVWYNIQRHTNQIEDRRYFRNSTLEKLKEELKELRETPIIGA